MKQDNKEGLVRLHKTLTKVPFLSGLLSAFLGVLTNISDAPIHLNSIQVGHKRAQDLLEVLYQHYYQASLKALLYVAGSQDLLGNPIHLVESLKQGTLAFLYQPALALSQGRPMHLALTSGAVQLASLAIGEVCHSVFKSFFSLSLAVSKFFLAKDHAYMRRRVQMQADVVRGKDMDGVAHGFYELAATVVYGLYEGLVGVVVSPYQGTCGFVERRSSFGVCFHFYHIFFLYNTLTQVYVYSMFSPFTYSILLHNTPTNT